MGRKNAAANWHPQPQPLTCQSSGPLACPHTHTPTAPGGATHMPALWPPCLPPNPPTHCPRWSHSHASPLAPLPAPTLPHPLPQVEPLTCQSSGPPACPHTHPPTAPATATHMPVLWPPRVPPSWLHLQAGPRYDSQQLPVHQAEWAQACTVTSTHKLQQAGEASHGSGGTWGSSGQPWVRGHTWQEQRGEGMML